MKVCCRPRSRSLASVLTNLIRGVSGGSGHMSSISFGFSATVAQPAIVTKNPQPKKKLAFFLPVFVRNTPITSIRYFAKLLMYAITSLMSWSLSGPLKGGMSGDFPTAAPPLPMMSVRYLSSSLDT